MTRVECTIVVHAIQVRMRECVLLEEGRAREVCRRIDWLGVLLFNAGVGIRAGGWAGLSVKWEGHGSCTGKPGDVGPNGL